MPAAPVVDKVAQDDGYQRKRGQTDNGSGLSPEKRHPESVPQFPLMNAS
jgi:hypothetical protein